MQFLFNITFFWDLNLSLFYIYMYLRWNKTSSETSRLCVILHSIITEKRGTLRSTVMETSNSAEISKNRDLHG